MTQPLPPAGYYPDPSGAPQQRFWDGTAWTARTQAFGPPAAAASTATYPATTYPATTYPATTDAAATSPATASPGTPYPTTYPPADAPAGTGPLSANAALGAIVGTLLTAAADQAAHTRTHDRTPDRDPLKLGQDFYRNHQRGVDTAAGGALLAEALVGLDKPGGHRPGIMGAVKGVVFGIVFAAVALGLALLSAPRDIQDAVSTRGTVTDVRTASSSSSRSCSIRAEYVVDGTTYTVSPSYSSSSLCDKRLGSSVDVRYDPADPGNAAVPEPLGIRLVPWALFALGLVITVVSAVRVVMRAVALGTGGWLLWRGLGRRGATR